VTGIEHSQLMTLSLIFTLNNSFLQHEIFSLWYVFNSQSQSQNYFTTSGLPPISSSWRQTPWGLWSDLLLQLNPCVHSTS
jgi:hypothetical protein